MTRQYDLVVIGTGTGASGAAARCRAAGWRVAVIDHLPFGGTCALRGCDPKKVLVGAAEAIDHVRRMRGHGLTGGEPAIAWDELIGFKRGFTEPVPAMKEKSFAKSGIDAYRDAENIIAFWDDILRFIATIKLKETTASDIFRRLNSYCKRRLSTVLDEAN